MPSREIHHAAVIGLLAILTLHAATSAQQQEPPKAKADAEQKYLRVQTGDKDQPVALQTAIVSYKGKNSEGMPVVVDLVGVVHIGDRSYYEKLNKLFVSYDAVLYELVAPEGTKVPKGGGKKKIRHPLTAMQRMMQSVLQLDYQLDQIDYTKENLIHADMSPDEFAKSMKDRDESFLKMFFRMMGQSAAMQGRPGTVSDAQLLAALFAKDRSLQLKRLMSRQFEQMEVMLNGFGGPDGSTIITERNKKALSVLKRELAAGKKRIAVFYGAGHLPDMDERMRTEFGMSRGKAIWLTAWQMKDKPSEPEVKSDDDVD
jgi:hypothetical protein